MMCCVNFVLFWLFRLLVLRLDVSFPFRGLNSTHVVVVVVVHSGLVYLLLFWLSVMWCESCVCTSCITVLAGFALFDFKRWHKVGNRIRIGKKVIKYASIAVFVFGRSCMCVYSFIFYSRLPSLRLLRISCTFCVWILWIVKCMGNECDRRTIAGGSHTSHLHSFNALIHTHTQAYTCSTKSCHNNN